MREQRSALFKVEIEWVGKTGLCNIDVVVAAYDAVEALQKAWLGDNPSFIREVKIEWLGSVAHIIDHESINWEAEKEAEKKLDQHLDLDNPLQE